MRDLHVIMNMSFTRAAKCLDRKELSFLQNHTQCHPSSIYTFGKRNVETTIHKNEPKVWNLCIKCDNAPLSVMIIILYIANNIMLLW